MSKLSQFFVTNRALRKALQFSQAFKNSFFESSQAVSSHKFFCRQVCFQFSMHSCKMFFHQQYVLVITFRKLDFLPFLLQKKTNTQHFFSADTIQIE